MAIHRPKPGQRQEVVTVNKREVFLKSHVQKVTKWKKSMSWNKKRKRDARAKVKKTTEMRAILMQRLHSEGMVRLLKKMKKDRVELRRQNRVLKLECLFREAWQARCSAMADILEGFLATL